jgi:hypothetical protein
MEESLQEGHVPRDFREVGSPPCIGRRKVAVLAVHGVAKHAAGETQNAIADLLLSLPAGEYHASRKYEPFLSVGLQIPLQLVLTGNSLRNPPPAKRAFDLYEERSADFAKCLPKVVGMRPAVGEVSTEYNDLLLDHYEGGADGNAYITARLEGKREYGPEVHVYEVRWSDLAKPESTVLSFFLALFQVLLHLASLSRIAIDTGAAETTGTVWKIYRRVQRYAVRMLQIFIPLLEIVLFVAITSCFTTIAKPTSGLPAIAVLLGGVGVTALAFLIVDIGKWSVRVGPWQWALLALLPGALGSGLAWGLIRLTGENQAAALLWWLVPGAALLYWILSNYEEVRAGAKVTGWILYGLAFLTFACFLATKEHLVVLSAFWVAELLLAAVRFCWALLIGLAFAALILGSCAWRWSWPKLPKETDEKKRKLNEQKRCEEKARARAAVRTSRLALALPSVLFMLVTLLIWSGFTKLAAKEVKDPLFDPTYVKWQLPWPWPPIIGALHLLPSGGLDESKPAEPNHNDDYVGNKIAWSVGYQLPATLALLGLAGFLLVWWALPSVLTERFPARNKVEPPRTAPDDVSVHMGTWLSRGLDSTAAVTLLLWSSIFLAPVLYLLLDDAVRTEGGAIRDVLNTLKSGTKLLVVSYAFAGTAILAALAKGGQTVLGVVLDVDTYLRTSPVEATPRAKIFERFISTLRYLNDPLQGYDSIVVIAHSLGALISGDLFLYVHAKKLEPLPVPTCLLTLGNPTRQLLNRFFPYLYDWVRTTPDNGLRPLPPPCNEEPTVIPFEERPHPHELGLKHWASAYRSGDYVGRSLWLNEWFWRTNPDGGAGLASLNIVRSEDCHKAEACIGAGAHTHYMDDTATEVAWMLDSLICRGQI